MPEISNPVSHAASGSGVRLHQSAQRQILTLVFACACKNTASNIILGHVFSCVLAHARQTRFHADRAAPTEPWFLASKNTACGSRVPGQSRIYRRSHAQLHTTLSVKACVSQMEIRVKGVKPCNFGPWRVQECSLPTFLHCV